MKKIYLFALAGAALLLSVVAFAQSFSALKGKDFAEKQPALTKMVSLQNATIPNRAPVAHRAIASVDELVGNYVSISKQYGYTEESGLQPAAVPLNGVSTTITKIDDTHIGITGFVTGATDAVTAEVNLSEGTLTIADGQTLFTHATYGPITMANSSAEAGTPLTATITDNGIVINEIWCDLIGGDGTYAGYLWSGNYFIGTTLVKSNGVMQYKNASEANNNGPANVYIEQDGGVAKVYNFAGKGMVVDINLKADKTVAIPSQMVNEGSTKTGAYYTYGVDVENSKLLAEIAGTGTANVLTFPGTWTIYSVNQYWYNYYTETSITLNEGSTFTYPALDIEISPETGADISAAITAAQGAAERLGNVTVTLAEGGAYTISAPIAPSAGFVINGNGATINASGLSDAFIKMDKNPSVEKVESGQYVVKTASKIDGVKITGLTKGLYADNGAAYTFENFTINNSVFQYNSQGNVVLNFASSMAINFNITNSTFFSLAAGSANFIALSGKRPWQTTGYENETGKLTVANNTFYNVAKAKQFLNTNTLKGQKYLYVFKSNIFADVSNKKIYGNMTNNAKQLTTDGMNTYLFDGAFFSETSYNGDTGLTTDPGFKDVDAGDFTIGASTAQAKMKTGDPRWLVDYVAPETSKVENINLEAKPGDITAQLNAKVAEIASKLNSVGDIFIQLEPEGDYSISAPIQAPASLGILGVGNTIDASKADANFIELKGSTKKALKADGTTESDHFEVENVSIYGVTITGLKKALVRDIQKSLLKTLNIENSVIEASNAKPFIDFDGKGYVEQLNVKNSTIWAKEATNKNFTKYGSRPKNLWTKDGDNDVPGPYTVQGIEVTKSTIVNIAAEGQHFCNNSQKGTEQNVYTIKNNVFVNCGKKDNQVIVGFNGGQTSATPVWDVDGNVFNYNGADTSAKEVSKAGKKSDADIVKNSIAGAMTFEDAAAGKFNGTLLTEDEPAASPVAVGDPRWTIEAKKDVYSKSLNIEQLVLDKTTKADIAAILAEKYIEISSNAGLDSLNDEKTLRNEPFLGLKIKAADATVKVLVKKGQVLNVKFGCVNDPVNVAINGTPIDTQVAKNTEGSVFTLPAAEADQEVVFTTTAKNTVVLKQIMIGEDIAAVTLPAATKYQVSVAEGIENGTVEFSATSMTDSKGYKTVKVGDEVTITATPAAGYEVETVTVKGVTSNEAIVVTDGKFIMPADAVTINATFKEIPKLYIIGDMNGWNRTAMTEMTFNAEKQVFEYEYAPTAVAHIAFADYQMSEAEASADADWSVFNSTYRYAIGENDQNVTLNSPMALLKVNGSLALQPVKSGTSYTITVAADFSTVTITGEAAPEPSEDTYIIAGSSAALLGTEWDGTNEANKLTLNETTGLYEKTYEGVTLAKGTIEFKIVKNGTTWIPDGMGNNHTCEIPADGVYTVKVTFNAANPEKVDDYEMVATPATGINGVKADALKDAQIYNMQGVRVDKAQKGLYIVNGRKVVIK